MISEAEQQLQQLRQTISTMELIFDSIDEAIVLLNQKNEIEWCNVIFSKLIRQQPIKFLGKEISSVFRPEKNDQKNIHPFDTLQKNIHFEKWRIDEFAYQANEEKLDLKIAITKCKKTDQSLFVVIIRNVTDEKKLQKQLEHLAHHDLLTNLPNRLLLHVFLKQELAKAQRHHHQFALLFIDINKFKAINDDYGHLIGDLFLQFVAKRLKKTVRAEDFVARVGGDEFVLIVTEIKDQTNVSHIIQKIKTALNTTYNVDDHILNNKISIGAALYPTDGKDVDQLMRIADERMYAEKKKNA